MVDQQAVTRQRVEDLRATLAAPLESASLGEVAASSAGNTAPADVKPPVPANRRRRMFTLQAHLDGETVETLSDGPIYRSSSSAPMTWAESACTSGFAEHNKKGTAVAVP